MRDKLLQFFLWWAVLGLSLWMGGTVFNMLVVVPLWAESAGAARRFFGETNFNTTIWHFFGPPWMAMRLFPIFAALGLAWPFRRHRALLLVTAATMVFGVGFTLGYVYDINDVLFTQAGGTLDDRGVEELIQKWIVADRLRFAVGLLGYLALLRAFRLPLPA